MARQPMITRTFTSTKVNALCIDLESCEPFNKDVTLPRTYKDKQALEKALDKLINDDKVKFVQAVSTKVVEELYGMTEQQFIETASILDKNTRKPV